MQAIFAVASIICIVALGISSSTLNNLHSFGSNKPSNSDWTTPSFTSDISVGEEEYRLDFDLDCLEFLSGNVDDSKILFVLGSIRLYHHENFNDFVLNKECSKLIVPKCHLFSGTQLRDFILERSDEDLQNFVKTGCVQRISRLEALTINDIDRLHNSGLNVPFEYWTSMSPAVLVYHLKLLENNGILQVSLKTTPKDQLVRILTSSIFIESPFAWERFVFSSFAKFNNDDGLYKSSIQILVSSPEINRAIFALFDPQRHLERISSLEKLDRYKSFGRLGISLNLFLFHLILHGPPTQEISQIVIEISKQLRTIDREFLSKICYSQETSNHQNLWDVWKTPFASLGRGIAWTENPEKDLQWTKSEKSFGKRLLELKSFFPHILLELKAAFQESKDWDFASSYSNFLYFMSSSEDMAKTGIHSSFLQAALRPEMSIKEIEKIKSLVKVELNGLERQTTIIQSTELLSNKFPQSIIEWLVLSSSAGSKEIFDYISTELPAITGEFGIVEDALVRLAKECYDLREAIVGIITDPARLLKILVHPRRSAQDELDDEESDESGNDINSDHAVLIIEQISEEEITNLPFADNRAFIPCYNFILHHPNAFKRHNFPIKFSNANSNDGGGPTRNYLGALLKIVMDPKRRYLERADSADGMTEKGGIVLGFGLSRQAALFLGRLIGKALQQNVGLGFQLDSRLLAILQNPSSEFIDSSFQCFYQHHLVALRSAVWDPEKNPSWTPEFIEFLEFPRLEFLRLTHRECPCNIGIKSNGEKIYIPKTPQESKEYFEKAYDMVYEEYFFAVNEFIRGLCDFINMDLLGHVSREVLVNTLRPKQDITQEQWEAAFHFEHCTGISVIDEKGEYLLEDEVPGDRIPIERVARHILRRLTLPERFALINQMTGTSLIPQTGLLQGSLKVTCVSARANAATLRMGEDDNQMRLTMNSGKTMHDNSEDTCIISNLSIIPDHSQDVQSLLGAPIAEDISIASVRDSDSVDSQRVTRSQEEEEDDDESSDENFANLPVNGRSTSRLQVQLPICMSCFSTLHLPAYRTASEVFIAIMLICKAADDFFHL